MVCSSGEGLLKLYEKKAVKCVLMLSIRNDDLYDDNPHSYYPRDADDYSPASRPNHMNRYRDESPPPSLRREHSHSDSSYTGRRKETSSAGEVQFRLYM